MRRIATLGLALSLAGCGAGRGPQVPLAIDESVTAFNQSCILMHEVVDVTADPVNGSLVLNDGTQLLDLKWPKGFTAWRSGIETEVTDATGRVVMRTGGRYSICPSEYLNGWVAGMVTPCPGCKLGFELD